MIFRSDLSIGATDTTEEIVAKVLARNRRVFRRVRKRDLGLAVDILDELAQQGYLVPSADYERGEMTTYDTGLPGAVAVTTELEPNTGIVVGLNGNGEVVQLDVPERLRSA